MKRRASTAIMVLYVAALVMTGVTVLALLGWLPNVRDMSISGLTNLQAIGVTLVLMALIGLRLFLHVRARRAPSASPSEPPTI